MGGWEVIKRYVELGLGISIVMNVCLTGRERLEVISVKKYFPKRVYGIVQLKCRALSPEARDFIATFKETLSASACWSISRLAFLRRSWREDCKFVAPVEPRSSSASHGINSRWYGEH